MAEAHQQGRNGTTLLWVGNSHVGAIKRAVRVRNRAGLTGAFNHEVLFFPFDGERDGEKPQTDVADSLAEAAMSRSEHVRALLLLIGGNEHHVLGLANHPRPFDFELPSAAGLPPSAERELIPFGLVQAPDAEEISTNFPLPLFSSSTFPWAV